MIIGIDVGGTFTDFTCIDAAGHIRVHKRLSTPDDPSRAVLDGLTELDVTPFAIIVHGSTVATNALLERKGARTALIATRGFADVIEIGRQNRPQLYALEPIKPEPLVPRELRFEIDERVDASGYVLRAIDPLELEACIQSVLEASVDSIAVSLLFSFLYPNHEQLIKQALAMKSTLFTSLSSDVLPEYREYERTSTTVINAYVAPLMARYLDRLANGLGSRRLRIMQSNGGVISALTASTQAARTALSGPAGGVVGAFSIARSALSDEQTVRVITFDMGGTSTDVALCDGVLPTTTEGEIAGLPLRLPMMDIHTVGAGGGSIARIDAAGALLVGPQSAGADPGPACYARGGDQPTVTDANLVLKRINATRFLGDAMPLDPDAAYRAISRLSRSHSSFALGHSSVLQELAWGVIRVANATMERAIRKISVERGHDPRRFTLVAFGGAGPLHACELAVALGIPRVLIPPSPGVLSAFGMAGADTVKDYSRAVLRLASMFDDDAFDRLFVELEARGREELLAEGIEPDRIVLQRAVDMRYVGQSYEITVQADRLSECLDGFHQLHAARYAHSHVDRAVEVVTARVKAIGQAHTVELHAQSPGDPDASIALVGEEDVWFEGRALTTQIYDRERLRAGHRIQGPAAIFQFDTTTIVPLHCAVYVDSWNNLLIEIRD